MYIKDIMTKQVRTVKEDDTVEKCANLLITYNLSGLPVIDENGKVGIIGGVDKKVAAAAKAKAVVFFAPTDQPSGVKKSETNYAEAVRTAKDLKTKMKIVPVATFEDALDYLTQHK